ncbi:FtsX-like permease family protein, partial [bacterium]|nr:FtsX-like permease family protein [bacterium]
MTNFKSVWEFLNKEKGISIISVVAIFVSFLLLGVILSFLVFSNTALNFLQKQVQVRVFFKDSFSEEQILTLKSELEKDPRIMEVGYTSKDEALRIFKEFSKNDPVLQESLSTNILPASLEIRATDVSDLDQIYEEFSSNENVESVKYLKDIKDRFSYVSLIVTVVSLIITFVFFLVSFGIILSTIRINIYSKKDEIEIVKLVGGSNDFVTKPFIHQGLVYSLTGSFFAGLVLAITLLIIYFTNVLGIKDLGNIVLFMNFRIPY